MSGRIRIHDVYFAIAKDTSRKFGGARTRAFQYIGRARHNGKGIRQVGCALPNEPDRIGFNYAKVFILLMVY